MTSVQVWDGSSNSSVFPPYGRGIGRVCVCTYLPFSNKHSRPIFDSLIVHDYDLVQTFLVVFLKHSLVPSVMSDWHARIDTVMIKDRLVSLRAVS